MICPSSPSSDLHLLERFSRGGDESAFEELVRRHGGMARGACRRVLGPGGDADDAAQQALLALAEHAPELTRRLAAGGNLAGWVYRVAVNAARQQRRSATARRRREFDVSAERPGGPDAVASAEHAELLSVLDEELSELPSQYRAALVLCHLQGRTQQEAAEELGLSYGTLRRRLDEGKRLLRSRFVRRGLTVTAAAVAAGLAAVAEAAPPVPPVPPSGPVSVVAPRVHQPGRVPRPGSRPPSPLSAKVYASLLAGLIVLCAVPPVLSAVTTADASRPADATPEPGPVSSGSSANWTTRSV